MNRRRYGLGLGLALGLMALAVGEAQRADAPVALALFGQVEGTHDPSMAKDGDVYYVFATGAAPAEGTRPAAPMGTARALLPQLPIRCSVDLHTWRRCGAVFPEVPAWIRAASSGTEVLWAPDISYASGEFRLYYAFSLFGKNTSGIALATNATLNPASPKYKWVDRGLVLRSTQSDDFNAIDPNAVADEKGGQWLAFGSFWSGIKLRRLDAGTGLLSGSDAKMYSLASRGPQQTGPRDPKLPPDTEAIEAPFVFRHDGYFYLFASWDLCCRGKRSTYREMVGRSRSVTGPYLDREGKPMLEGGGTALLTANATWVGPGGASLVHAPSGDVIVFHAYSARDGMPALQISTIVWKDGWPVAALGDGSQ